MKTEIRRDVFRRGKKTIAVVVETDDETNIETTTITMTQGKQTYDVVIERDLVTGKILPPPAPPPREEALEQLRRAVYQALHKRETAERP